MMPGSQAEAQDEAWKRFYDRYLAFKVDGPAADVSKAGKSISTTHTYQRRRSKHHTVLILEGALSPSGGIWTAGLDINLCNTHAPVKIPFPVQCLTEKPEQSMLQAIALRQPFTGPPHGRSHFQLQWCHSLHSLMTMAMWGPSK